MMRYSVLRRNSGQQGDVALYLAVMMATIMISAVLVLAGVLARQISFSHDVVASERAFYAAYSGGESVLYEVSRAPGDFSQEEPLTGELEYQDGVAIFRVCGETGPAWRSQGEFKGEVRRLSSGETDCQP